MWTPIPNVRGWGYEKMLNAEKKGRSIIGKIFGMSFILMAPKAVRYFSNIRKTKGFR